MFFEMVVPVIVSVAFAPVLYTPPPPSSALLLEMVTLVRALFALVELLNRPPPLPVALLLEMVALLFIVRVALSPVLYTPAPSVAVL
ncbi:MAG: hypothetical protein Q4C70_03205, partial [Planctomycetia bacterium]|nr:hypothetical protein [Planctomycetia bacterium]